jgi:plasmid stabilization system protein ParE
MAKKSKILLSDNFERNLADIEQFLVDAGASQAFDALLDGLDTQVIPNLEEFPNMGSLFLARDGRSVEVKRALTALRGKLNESTKLRVCFWSDYLLLYASSGKTVTLLSIKHHRQLSFDLNSRWN